MNFVTEDKAEVSKRDILVLNQEINELEDKLMEKDKEINELRKNNELFRQQDDYLQRTVRKLTKQNEELLKKLEEKDEEIKELNNDRLQSAILDSDTDDKYIKTYKSYHLKLQL